MFAVDADLRAESAGVRVHIAGRGSVLTCTVSASIASLARSVMQSRSALRLLRSVIPVLTRTGLRIDFVVGSRRVGRSGAGVRPNALARLLRLPATHIGS